MGKSVRSGSSRPNSDTNRLILHRAICQNLYRGQDYSSDDYQKLSAANKLLTTELDLFPNVDWGMVTKTFEEHKDIEVSYQTTELFCNYAASLYLQGKKDESIKYFETAVSRRFRDAYHSTKAYWFLSLIHSERQEFDTANRYSELCAKTGGFYTHWHTYLKEHASIEGKYSRLEFSWSTTILLLHVSVGQRHQLHLCIPDAGITTDGSQATPIWLKTEPYDAEIVQEELSKLIADPLYLLHIFQAQETETIMRTPATTGWIDVFGDSMPDLIANTASEISDTAGNTQATSPEEHFYSGGPLEYGNRLVEKFLNSPSFPNTLDEVKIIARFFSQPNIITGLFGNLKFLLKELTSRFEARIEQDPDEVELVNEIAGCLGLGYGQVEGYLSKGTMSPKYFISLESETLRLLSKSDLFQDRYPSLNTAQYLARNGINLLKKLRKMEAHSAEFAFKLHALKSANHFDERSIRFPEYQILTNEIVFGSAGVTRTYDSRKYRLQGKVDLSDSISKEVVRMTDAEKNSAKQWCQSTTFSNPTILLYAFELACELGVKIELTADLIAMLSHFNSTRIFAAISEQLGSSEPQIIYDSIDSECSFGYLLVADEKVLSNLRLSVGDSLKWLKSYNNFPFDQRGVQLSILALRGLARPYIEETLEAKSQRLELQTELMFKLGEYSNFEPFEEWKFCFDWISDMDAKDQVRVLGLVSEQPGALAYVKNFSQELIEGLASLLQVWDPEKLSKIIIALVTSHHQIAGPVLTRILSSSYISYPIDQLFNNSSDPRILLAIIKARLETSPADAILHLLEKLSADDKAVFWRMNGHEVEAVFRNWPGFGRFMWEKSETLPRAIHEIFDGYSWLSAATTSALNASDIAKSSDFQASLLGKCITLEPAVLENDTLLRAVLTAPNSQLNTLATDHAISSGAIVRYWLFMLESNLPITAQAGLDYLTRQKDKPDFESKLMMALDSNDKFARTSAISLLATLNSSDGLSKILVKLAESSHLDVWDFVSRKMSSISDSKVTRQFTRTLFLSRLKARAQKERVKEEMQMLPQELAGGVDQETLIRMALSSAAMDREWALRQLVELDIDSDDVNVEVSWKAGKDV